MKIVIFFTNLNHLYCPCFYKASIYFVNSFKHYIFSGLSSPCLKPFNHNFYVLCRNIIRSHIVYSGKPLFQTKMPAKFIFPFDYGRQDITLHLFMSKKEISILPAGKIKIPISHTAMTVDS